MGTLKTSNIKVLSKDDMSYPKGFRTVSGTQQATMNYQLLILSAFTGRIPPPKDPDGVATVSWDCAMPTLLGEGAGQAVTQPSVWDDL